MLFLKVLSLCALVGSTQAKVEYFSDANCATVAGRPLCSGPRGIAQSDPNGPDGGKGPCATVDMILDYGLFGGGKDYIGNGCVNVDMATMVADREADMMAAMLAAMGGGGTPPGRFLQKEGPPQGEGPRTTSILFDCSKSDMDAVSVRNQPDCKGESFTGDQSTLTNVPDDLGASLKKLAAGECVPLSDIFYEHESEGSIGAFDGIWGREKDATMILGGKIGGSCDPGAAAGGTAGGTSSSSSSSSSSSTSSSPPKDYRFLNVVTAVLTIDTKMTEDEKTDFRKAIEKKKPEGSTFEITFKDTSTRGRRQLLAASTEVTVVYTFGATLTGEDAAAAFFQKVDVDTYLDELKAVLPDLADKMSGVKASHDEMQEATTPELDGASSLAPSIVAATVTFVAAMVF